MHSSWISQVLLVSFLPAITFAACDDITFAQGTDYRSTAGGTMRASRGIVCPSGQNCTITSDAIVSATRYINITTTSDTKAIYDLVARKFPSSVKLHPHISNNLTNSYAQRISAGQAGYIGFTPFFNCIVGTLGSCSNIDIPSQTAVQVCAPATFGSNATYDGQLSGSIGFVQVTGDDNRIRNLTDAPTEPLNGNGAYYNAPGILQNKDSGVVNGAGVLAMPLGSVLVLGSAVAWVVEYWI